MPKYDLEKQRKRPLSDGAMGLAPPIAPPLSKRPSPELEKAVVINKYQWIRQEGFADASNDVLASEIALRCRQHLTRQGALSDRSALPGLSVKDDEMRVLAWNRFSTVQTLILTSLSQISKAVSQLAVLGIGYDKTEDDAVQIADRWRPFDSFTLVSLWESDYFDTQSWNDADRDLLRDLKNNRAWGAVSEHDLLQVPETREKRPVWNALTKKFKAEIARHEEIARLMGVCDAFEFFVTMVERDVFNPFVEVDDLHYYLDELADRTLHNFEQDEPNNYYFQDEFMERFRLAYKAQTERGRILRYERAAGVIYASLDQYEREWDVSGNKLKHIAYRDLGIFEDQKRLEFMRLRIKQRYELAFASRRDPKLFTIRLIELLNALGVTSDVDEAFRSGLVIEFISLDWDYIWKLDAALEYLVGAENMGDYLSKELVGTVGDKTTHDMEQTITSTTLFGGLKRKTERAFAKLFENASDYTPAIMQRIREDNYEANELKAKAAKITDEIVDQEKAGRFVVVDDLKTELENIQREIKELTPWLEDERAKDRQRVIEKLKREIDQKKDESEREERGIPRSPWQNGVYFMTPGDPRRLEDGGRLDRPSDKPLKGQSDAEWNESWVEYEATLKLKTTREAERREAERKKADNAPFKGFSLVVNGKKVKTPAELQLQQKRERERSERESDMERRASVRERWAEENRDRLERENREEDERQREREGNLRRSRLRQEYLADQRLQWATWGNGFG